MSQGLGGNDLAVTVVRDFSLHTARKRCLNRGESVLWIETQGEGGLGGTAMIHGVELQQVQRLRAVPPRQAP